MKAGFRELFRGCIVAFALLLFLIPVQADWSVYQTTLSDGDFMAVDSYNSGGVTSRIIVGEGEAWISGSTSFRPMFSIRTDVKFNAIDVISPGVAAAVGDNGAFMLWDGTEWSEKSTAVTENLNGVYAVSEMEIYLVGDNGTILIWDGTACQPMDSGVSVNLNAINGETSDIFIAGDQGTVLKKDGQDWTAMETPTANDLYGITYPGDTGIFVCGREGALLRYYDSEWTVLDSGTANDLHAIVYNYTQVYAVGDSGTIVHYQNGACTLDTSPVETNLHAISRDLVCVGENGTILERRGQYWTQYFVSQKYNAILGTGSSNIYVAGDFGRLIHWDGSDWGWIPTGTDTDFTSLKIDSDGVVYFSGKDGWIYTWDGTETRRMTRFLDGAINGMEFSNPDDIYIIAQGGAIGDEGMIAHYDGNTWTLPVRDAETIYRDLYCSDSGGVFAVGTKYQILYPPYGPPIWEQQNGVIRHFNGSEWTSQATFITDWMHIRGTGPNEILLSSWSGLAYATAYDVYPVAGPTYGSFIWGVDSDHLILLDDWSEMRVFDGWGWSAKVDDMPDINGRYSGIWGASMEDFMVIGESHSIAHWTGTLAASLPSGAYLRLNQHEFHAGEPFELQCKVQNASNSALSGKLFVALDIGDGTYFFWPGWKQYPPEVDYMPVQLEPGASQTFSVLEFTNPELQDWYHCRWYSVVTDESDQLFGTFDYEDFSLAP